jgi:hypothetical protein
MSAESSSYSPSSSPSSSVSSSPKKIAGDLKSLKAKSGKRSAILTELTEVQEEISHRAKSLAYHQRKSSECMTGLANLEEKKQKLLGQLEPDDIFYAPTQSSSKAKVPKFSVLETSNSGGSLAARFNEEVNRALSKEGADGGGSSITHYKK